MRIEYLQENPSVIHSELNWRELREVLIKLGYLNSKGSPAQECRIKEQMGYTEFYRQMWVSHEIIEWMIKEVTLYVEDNGIPKEEKLTLEKLRKTHKNYDK
jgi:hypothetical protein